MFTADTFFSPLPSRLTALCGRNTHHDKQSSICSSVRKFISSEAVQQLALVQVLPLLSRFYDPERVASRKNEEIQS